MEDFTVTITNEERADVHMALRYLRDQGLRASLEGASKIRERIAGLLSKFSIYQETK